MNGSFSSHHPFDYAPNKFRRVLRALFFWQVALLLLFPTTGALAQPFAYVTNFFSDNVSVINTATNTVVAAVPLGSGIGPQGIALTPDGSFAYVVNHFPDNVSVINTATNTVVATVSVSYNPVDVALTPNGSFAYVVNTLAGLTSGTVSVINTASNTVVATVGVGYNPSDVALTPNGSFAYVTNYSSSDVSVINTASNTVVATVSVGTAPQGVAITPNGSFAYVTNLFSNNVSVINTASNTVVATVSTGSGSGPQGVAITPNGDFAYVTNLNPDNVSVINTASNTVVATVPVGDQPRNVVITSDGGFAYVTNVGSNNVSVINTASNSVIATVPVGDSPIDVAITPAPAEMEAQGNGVSIADGDNTPDVADDTDFGSIDISSGTASHAFTIANTGALDLNLTGSPKVQISGTNAADFTVTTQPASPVSGGDATTFTIEFNPSAVGLRTATVSIANNDADENPYDFAIEGTGTGAPEMDVQGNSVSIVDGDATPSSADHTDFGSADITSGSVDRVFTVANLGNVDLNLTGTPKVQITGGNAADFSVTIQPVSPIASSGNTTFTVHFDPSAVGLRSATISIANDDADENPYDFAIQGTGTVKPFVFIANKDVIIERPLNSEGAIHANNDVTFKKGKNSTHTGDLTAVDDITVGSSNTIIGNATAGDKISNSGVITGVITPNGNVPAEVLPAIPPFTPGTDDIEVADGAVLALAPGDYATVTAGKGATLMLSSGTYNLESLILDEQAVLALDVSSAAIIINVADDMAFDKEVKMQLTPAGAFTGLVTINFADNDDLTFDKESVLLGNFIAPLADLTLEKDSFFQGAMCADNIVVKKNVTFVPHGSSTAVPAAQKASEDLEDLDSEEQAASLPAAYELAQNYPNPFNPSTVISFQLPVVSEVTLVIYNINGQLVKKLVAGEMNAGRHSVVWDATNAHGARVASGMYLYVIKAGEFTARRKLVLMK